MSSLNFSNTSLVFKFKYRLKLFHDKELYFSRALVKIPPLISLQLQSRFFLKDSVEYIETFIC